MSYFGPAGHQLPAAAKSLLPAVLKRRPLRLQAVIRNRRP